jgi:NAD(P)-dependent dehydrogenase (short-subunit alcohol dehydrogenase family)
MRPPRFGAFSAHAKDPEEDNMKTALVTGGAKRIGRAIALGLAQDGWAVAIHHHHSVKEAASLVGEIERAGGKAVSLQADLTNAQSVSQLVPDAAAAIGPLTLLVNNASLFERDEASNMMQAGWDAHMNANLRTPAFLAQAFAAQLPAGLDGNIINMLDQRVWRPTPKFLSYTLSKMALWDMTRLLALSFAPHIRVNGVGPGPTLKNARQSDADFTRQAHATILRRSTTPDEIYAAIRFIIASPAMTGQMIALDGGQHLAWETPDVVNITE